MSPLWDFQVHIKLITHISHDYFITPIYRITSDTSAANSTFAQLRTIGWVLFKRVRDFWKMMLCLAVIFKAHTFAGGMDVFPSCFPPFRIPPGWGRFKAQKIRPVWGRREGGKEGGCAWRCHHEGITKPICTMNSVISQAENWGAHFAKTIGIHIFFVVTSP